MATAVVALLAVTGLMAAMKPNPGRDEIIEISDAAVADYQETLAKMDAELAVVGTSRSSETAAEMEVAPARTGAGGDGGDGYGEPVREREASAEQQKPTLANRLDGTRWLSLLIGLALAVYLGIYFAGNGLNLTLDIVNWTFLCLGLLLARSALHYVKLIGNASTAVGQIILQYPFYAGIMGMMAGTGLISVFASWFTSISSAGTLGFWAFLSGGILNMFVPSGGGQWAIQGPIFIEAAQSLGTDPSRVVMGVAYGDQWTNMIQPFFTIPLLAIAGLHVRQIMGYTFLVLIVTGVVFAGGILLAGSGA
jgi:short-chain fatty acids transporter